MTSLKTGPISLRALRLMRSEGGRSVLLTNIQDEARISTQMVLDLYMHCWVAEVHELYEKTSL